MTIELKGVSKTYSAGRHGGVNVRAVRDVSLSIPSNKIFGVIGKSGAGKSTLARLVSLLERPDEGEIFFDGERVDNLEGKALIARRRKMGMIFQNFNLFSSRSAGRNIAYPLEICGESKAKINARVDELLSLVGLSDKRDEAVSKLSGGQKQRVAIARALANDPGILFCDEATSALDPQTTKSILGLIRDIQRKMNLTVVMITHQMEVARDAANMVAVIDKGRVIETGDVNEIFLRPKSPVTKEFLANLSPIAEDDAGEDFARWSEHGGKYALRFPDDLTDTPALSLMARKFNVEFNVRAGGIQRTAGGKVGTLIVDISGSEVDGALGYLRGEGIMVEEA